MSSNRPNRIRHLSDQELDLNTLKALVGAAPNLPSLWIRLAFTLESSGRMSDALEAWKRAGLLVPNSEVVAEALSRLGESAHGDESQPVDSEFRDSVPGYRSEEQPDSSAESRSDSKSEPLDIDTLITDLQSGSREPTVDHTNVDDLPDQTMSSDLVVSETLAKIYEAQNHLDEAVRIYEILADQEKDANKSDVLRGRAADLRKRMPKSR